MKSTNKNRSEIKFQVELDENKVPENIKWSASEKDKGNSDATLISIWDQKEKNTLRLDLWTKEMKIEEMNMFFYQTLNTLSQTFKRATSNETLAKDLHDFADYFGRKSGAILDQNNK